MQSRIETSQNIQLIDNVLSIFYYQLGNEVHYTRYDIMKCEHYKIQSLVSTQYQYILMSIINNVLSGTANEMMGMVKDTSLACLK